jgi:cellulose synthase (UDP-forming)
MNMVSRGNITPVIHDVSQLIGAIPITRAAIVGLLKPFGHPFKVTAKGGDRSKIQVQWRMMAPFLTLLILTIIGLTIGIASDSFAFYDAGEGKAVVLFWTIYNVFVLFFTVVLCVELPRNERHVADAPELALLLGDPPRPVWMAGLTTNKVRIRGVGAEVGTMMTLRIDGVGDVAATVLAETPDGARLQLLPTSTQAEDLDLRFYAEDNVPGISGATFMGVMRGLGRRLAFSSGR